MGSDGASWDIMRSQAEFQIDRTVEMRSWGGRDLPHSRLVRREKGVVEEVEGVEGRREFMGRRWRRVGLGFRVLAAENGGDGWRREKVDMASFFLFLF